MHSKMGLGGGNYDLNMLLGENSLRLLTLEDILI